MASYSSDLSPRIRGYRLQKIRAQHFHEHPLCAMCCRKGRVTIATQLDHIVPLHKGGLDFDQDDGGNRQGLCEPCHDDKTAVDMGWGPGGGCDAKGLPTDPRHPWNRVK